jgi:hypothetical protein
LDEKPAAGAVADAATAGEPVRDKKPAEPAAEMLAARVAPEEKRERLAAAQIAPAPPAPNVPAEAAAPRKQSAADVDRAAPAAMGVRKDVRNLQAGEVTVSVPGGSVLWRFGPGGRVERSDDAGGSWHAQSSGVTADLLAGAAPSPASCWIVGTAGTVLLTADGERWERLPFPEVADLVAVEASSARAATVTTRDGRRFNTLDSGRTWSLR